MEPQIELDAYSLALLDQLLADTGSGHNIVATVYLECRSMYRADGPNEMKPVGETEFVNGVAAMAASGLYGKTLACAGIVSHAELLLGGGGRDRQHEAGSQQARRIAQFDRAAARGIPIDAVTGLAKLRIGQQVVQAADPEAGVARRAGGPGAAHRSPDQVQSRRCPDQGRMEGARREAVADQADADLVAQASPRFFSKGSIEGMRPRKA